MGVWSSLRHGARVARSAGTLAAAGAAVTVVAATWNRDEQGTTRHPLGFDAVTVKRPAPRALAAGSRGMGPAGLLAWLVRSFPAQWRFVYALWHTDADVYHAHDLQALPWVWLAARLRRRPVIYDAHEISVDRTGTRRLARLITHVEGFLARRSEAMITTTDMRADFFEQAYGVPRPVVLQNRPHHVEVVRTDHLRARLAIPHNLPIVLYQGGLQPNRGLPRLVEAAAAVDGAHFVLLGDGVMRSQLENMVAERALQARVHFLPAVPWQELAEWTASADVGVQLLENTGLNHYTTDSNKIFEYAMAGLPVIASDFPEIRRVVAGHDIGVLVDPADTGAVIAAMRRLTMDAELRIHYARNALRARRELSWETQEPKLLSLYGV
jgi:glycosyltransferase involved in cell wall biosynthesis